MENPPDDLEDPPPFWCHICRIACVSAVNLQSHFLGARHRRAEEALKENREGGGEEEAAKAEESLEDQINALGNAEPALGLEYIYEYRSHNRYQCKLCNCFLGRTHMFMHIVGARHRIQYLGEHHPATGISNASVTKGAKRLRRLREICIRVEQEFGRNRINVVRDEDQVFSCDDPTPTLPCAVYRPNAKLKKMDFTSDEFMEVAEAPEEHEEGVVTFLELKKAHEVGGPENHSGEPEKGQSTGPEKNHVKNKEHELDNKDHSGVYNTEPNPDLDTLPSHEEVFEYLQSFEVHELKHIHFLIKVTDSLRRILTRYRNDEEKKKMEANDGHNQQPLTSQGYPHQPAPILPPEDSVPNPTRCEEEAPANEGHRAVWLSANQLWKRNPQEKLSFRIAAPPPEKNSLVSTQLLSNLQQDFAAKSKPKKIAAASMTHVDEENFAEDPTPPFQPVYDHARDGEEHRVSSSKPGTSSASRHLMAMPPDRVGAGFTKGQFPNEGSATVAAYPHEHVGYTTGSWASNVHDSLVYDRTQEQRLPSSKHHPGPSIAEPGHPMAKPPDRAGAASGRGPYPNEGPAMVSYPHKLLGNPTGSASEPFRNVAGFPDTQDRVRNSAPLYPPGEPVRTPAGSVFPGAAGSQEVLRNVSASSALRTPDSYRQPANSAGAANPPAPFLQQFTAAPGGSPSIFPRDDVTALFFESLKDMDISEVTSTLNKLTATNPAFQRIHVPSLVRYLMDTGKIRTSHRPGNL
ncbi:uncharacterized protein ACMZJ9_007736 [Mantella aurantiaca]